jgi:hypothetical protein
MRLPDKEGVESPVWLVSHLNAEERPRSGLQARERVETGKREWWMHRGGKNKISVLHFFIQYIICRD